MTRYWLTTHWPPYQSGVSDTFHIYIQDQFKSDLDDLHAGDKVFIYEYKSGPNVIDARGEVIHRRKPGREGIVCEAELTTDLHMRPGYVQEHFEGRGKRNFCWQALSAKRILGLVRKVQVNMALDYAPRNHFFGFNGGRGIKEVSPEQYAKLHRLLVDAGA